LKDPIAGRLSCVCAGADTQRPLADDIAALEFIIANREIALPFNEFCALGYRAYVARELHWALAPVKLKERKMASKPGKSIIGKFAHLVYSPKGAVEGVLLDVGRKPAQIVFEKCDEQSARAFEDLKKGQKVVLKAKRLGPSPKGEAEHPVFSYIRLVSVDGIKPTARKRAKGTTFSGTVVRFNYARHGARNGVVLDTGDFVHTRPEGLVGLKIKLGDKVSADGDTQPLVGGRGNVIEAIRVNGKRVRKP
jgi:hypothetical protein